MNECVPNELAVPKIETERLILRGHRPADLKNSADLWSDPEVVRYVGGKPLSKEEVWARMLRYVGHWAWVGYGYWVIEEKATGQFVGEAGFGNCKRDIQPSITGLPELGWVLATAFQGKGYATEVGRAAISWGKQHLKSRRIVCIINPENVRSIHVAEKCGFREWQRGVYRGNPTMLFEREYANRA
jgi:RimJ/RimL family protein N-acetyltransferase